MCVCVFVSNQGPTTTHKQIWICDICHKQIYTRKQISLRCNKTLGAPKMCWYPPSTTHRLMDRHLHRESRLTSHNTSQTTSYPNTNHSLTPLLFHHTTTTTNTPTPHAHQHPKHLNYPWPTLILQFTHRPLHPPHPKPSTYASHMVHTPHTATYTSSALDSQDR